MHTAIYLLHQMSMTLSCKALNVALEQKSLMKIRFHYKQKICRQCKNKSFPFESNKKEKERYLKVS